MCYAVLIHFVYRKWREYLESLKLNDEPLFFQHFTLFLFNQMLSDKFKDGASASETSTCEFTYEEENAIRYMGGYVIRKIREKKNMDVSFLEDSDKVYLQSHSIDWINAIDRGGLIHITDSCFQLFLAIETVTRLEMKATTVMDDTFRQHLENMITCDSEVLFCWTLITVDESHDNIFHELIKLWITIRGFSFAKSIIEKYRLATKREPIKLKGCELNFLLMNLNSKMLDHNLLMHVNNSTLFRTMSPSSLPEWLHSSMQICIIGFASTTVANDIINPN